MALTRGLSMGRTIAFQRRLLFTTLGLAYVATGILSALPGASLLQLASNTHVSLEVVGGMFTLSAAGLLLGALLAGGLIGRIQPQALLAAGLLCLATGSLGIALTTSFPLLLAAQTLKGIGFGCIDISLNSIATLSFHERLSENLNTIHGMYGLGALLGPLILAIALQFFNSLPLAYMIGAGVAAIPCVLILGQSVPALPERPGATPPRVATRQVLRQGLLWLMVLQISLYAGAEVGFGNWIVTVVSKSAGITLALAAPVETAFYIGLTAGRLGGAQILRRGWLSEKHLLFLALLGGCVSGALATLGQAQMLIVYPASALVGWFYGPLFPSIMAIASRRFTHAVGLVTSVMTIGTGASVMLIPAMMGTLIPALGINRVIALPVLCCLAIIPLLALTSRAQAGEWTARPPLTPREQADLWL
jgi:fucose permease